MTKRGTTVQLNISIPKDIHKDLVKYADDKRRTISNAVAFLLREILRKEN